jgi:ankyrin repeat protein
VVLAALADAVRARDLATVTAMLASRPDFVHLDMSEHNEHRVLHYAVLNRDAPMVRLLMEHGADPFKGIWPHRDATGARTLAADRGDAHIVAIIDEELRRRADAAPGSAPHDVPRLERSAPALARLWEAMATSGDEAAAIVALEAEPRLIHWHQGDVWTPLHQASLMLFLDVARWLIAHGADVNAHEPCYWTPLELVGVYRKNFTPAKAGELKDLLVSHGARMTGGAAIVLGDADWLKARHAEGTLTNPPGEYGLVSRAAIRNRPEMVTLLLDLGLDPDERHRLEALEEDVFSWGVPLRECARAGNLAVAEILLQRGADPNPRIYAASSPLFEAYAQNNRDLIALLERHGSVTDALVAGYFGLVDRARDLLAETPAVAAELLVNGADGGHVEVVRLALAHLEWPPADARWHGHLMRVLGAHPEADRGRYFTCFRLMLDRAGSHAPGAYGRSILHDVCGGWPRETSTAEERLALATLLLDAGARLDGRDDLLRSTPLGWACRWGRSELVNLFLERGADPREPETEPWATPRAWAERMNRGEILRYLDGAVS